MPFILIAIALALASKSKGGAHRSHPSLIGQAAAGQAQVVAAAKAAGFPVPDFLARLPPEQQLAYGNAVSTGGASLILLDPQAAAIANHLGRLFG